MKTLKYTFLFAVALLFSSCDTNDDGFYNNVFADIPNLVTVETQPNYIVGDNLYITANFSRYLNETGETNPLDIYTTTGGAPEFNFSYNIEKQVSADVWETVFVDDSQLDIIEGDAQNGAYVYGHCTYDTTDETYKYNVGFPLLSAGQYRLSFGYNSTSTNSVELRSLSAPAKLILNINSIVSSVNGSGYYTFTVN
jgi:hypothetical protein